MAGLLQWWNLVFVLPFALAVLYYLALASGTVALDGDHDYDVDHDHDGVISALTFLGIGRAPLSIVLTTFALVWGLVGYASNRVLEERLPPSVFAWVSLALAAAAATLLTRWFSRLVARVVPRTQSYGISRADLRGRTGEVRFAVSETFGSAVVVDQHNFPHEVDCRVRPGQPPIPVGRRVYLTEYDPEQRLFYVMSEQAVDDLIVRPR